MLLVSFIPVISPHTQTLLICIYFPFPWNNLYTSLPPSPSPPAPPPAWVDLYSDVFYKSPRAPETSGNVTADIPVGPLPPPSPSSILYFLQQQYTFLWAQFLTLQVWSPGRYIIVNSSNFVVHILYPLIHNFFELKIAWLCLERNLEVYK